MESSVEDKSEIMLLINFVTINILRIIQTISIFFNISFLCILNKANGNY